MTRKEVMGHIFGLYVFDQDGACKNCRATDWKLNKVGHCESCQDELDRNAGLIRRKTE